MTQIHNTAKAILFSCIDDRLVQADDTFIAAHGGAFHASLAGGGAAFLDAADRAVALKQIVAAYKINHATTVYLESHTDCGAYRLAGVTFASPEAEITRLYADLAQAAGYIKAALLEAGATESELVIETRVINPAGQFIAPLA
jgi:carbonic anhydrase